MGPQEMLSNEGEGLREQKEMKPMQGVFSSRLLFCIACPVLLESVGPLKYHPKLKMLVLNL